MQARKKTVHVVPLRKADILAKKLDKYVEKGIRYWKSQGAAALAEKVVTKVKMYVRDRHPIRNGSDIICRTGTNWRNRRKHPLDTDPRFLFVVPLYKTPEKYLRRLTESFQEQTYSNWELCFSDGSGHSHR